MAQYDRRLKLFLLLLPVLTIPFVAAAAYLKGTNFDERSRASADLTDVRDISQTPQFLTVAPKTAKVGEKFRYVVRVSDADTPAEQLQLKINEGPDWLSVESGFILTGTPVLGQTNVAKVIIEVTDGKQSSTQTFYLLILEQDE